MTGGTSGLGLAVAQRLVRLGAHVSIVARNKDNLATALESLEVSAFLFLTQADFFNSTDTPEKPYQRWSNTEELLVLA